MTTRISLRSILAVAAVAPLIGHAHAERDELLVYPAFGTLNSVIIEGRVTEFRQFDKAETSDGALRNLVSNVRRFKNEEREGVPVTLRVGENAWLAVTDEEGYFRVETSELSNVLPGWQVIDANTASTNTAGRALVLPPENRRGLISDLDDTILVTEVTSKPRMLGNTFLKNPAQRAAVPAMAELYRSVLAKNPYPDASPLFYLSASPRQLHESIATFLALNDFPPGVLITKRVTNDRSSEPLLDQFAYKTQKIEDILSRTPGVRFILVGDDGERDPEIYDAVRQKHPDRIEAIWIRRVNPDRTTGLPAGQLDLIDVLRNGAMRPVQ